MASSRVVEQQVGVYLCHAGEDKHRFVSDLESALRRAGFRVFQDVKNMIMGQTTDVTIQPAVRKARAVVILLSLDFVGRPYLMKALDWALQNRKTVQAVPVFYGGIARQACLKLLDADVGADEEAWNILAKLEAGTQDPVVLRKWKAVLVEIAKLGIVDPKVPLAMEADLVDTVVQEVFSKTGRPLLKVPEYTVELVGGDGRVQELVELLANGNKLGLYGAGGIGKTTLANAIFNKLAGEFSPGDRASYEVGLKHGNKHLLMCANAILKQLGRPELSSLGELHTPLRGRRVLLLLDNMWHVEQVEQLVKPLLCGLADSSMVLCTSRSKDLLSRIKEIDGQEVKGLEDLAAKRLFRWHAFGLQDSELRLPPAIEIEEAKVLKVCAGVPLALEVTGSFIFKTDKKFDLATWKDALACLRQSKDGVMERILGLSLKLLGTQSPAAVDMFYDVACFLRGESKALALLAWIGMYDEDARAALYDLLSLNLCEEDSMGRLTMLHLLWELGRSRARKLAQGNWKQQKWLWDCDEAFNNLKKAAVSAEVRTLQLVRRPLAEVPPQTVHSMRNLRFLSVDCDCESVELNKVTRAVPWPRVLKTLCSWPSNWTMDCFPAELLWLRCAGANWESLPDALPFEELRVLQLVHCVSLRTLSNGVSALTNLQALELLKCSSLSSLPEGLSCLVNLQTLDLSGCSSLSSLPEGLSCLVNLQTLNLWECSRLSSLPKGLSCLINLQALALSGCWSLRHLPEGLSCLVNLQTLKLWGCSSLSSLPKGLSCLVNLQTLELSGCSSLSSLPEGLSCLVYLHTLKLSGCISLSSLPEGLSCLVNLQTLKPSECSRLSSLPEGLSCLVNLHTLDLSGCRSLSSLPEGLSCLVNLQTLYLSRCSSLSSLPEGLSCLVNLQTLALWKCSSLSSLPEGLSCLVSLQALYLSGCSSLSSLPKSVSCLVNLPALDLSGCSSLSSLPEGLSCLVDLQMLRLSGCSSLSSLPEGLSCLVNLQTLDLSGCRSLSSLPDGLSCLVNLPALGLSGCSRLSSLPKGLSCLVNLHTLKLLKCSSLNSLPKSLSCLDNLHSVCLSECSSLRGLPEGLSCLVNLQALYLSGCSSLSSLPEGLSCLVNLQTLDLWKCISLSSLPKGLSCLLNLHTLQLWECSSLSSLPEGVNCLVNLQTLDLSGCNNLSSLPEGLSCLIDLQALGM